MGKSFGEVVRHPMKSYKAVSCYSDLIWPFILVWRSASQFYITFPSTLGLINSMCNVGLINSMCNVDSLI